MFYSFFIGLQQKATRWHNEMMPDSQSDGNDDEQWRIFYVLFLFFFPISFFCLLQRAFSLNLTLQSTTFAGQQPLLIWQRESSDGTEALVFNLRFVQGADQDDAGLAASEVHASSSQQSGSVQVVWYSLMKGTLVIVYLPEPC